MNKFAKCLTLLGVVLTGGALLSGCSLTPEQEASINDLTNHAGDIVQVIDKQNKQLSKKEAVEMIEQGRTKNNYLVDFKNLEMNVEMVLAKSWVDVQYQKNSGEAFSMTTTIVNDYGTNTRLELHKESDSGSFFKKYDYKTTTGYRYNLDNKTITGALTAADFLVEQRVDLDIFAQFEIGTFTEDMILDIEATENGYVFTLCAEGTIDEEEKVFTNIISNLVITVNNNRIKSVEGYVVLMDYNVDAYDWTKDDKGNYITKYNYFVEPVDSQIGLINVSYKYDEEVDAAEVQNVYEEAQAKFLEL